MAEEDKNETPENVPVKMRYRWPWFVLAAVILGMVLAVLWMSYAVSHLP